jgi:hypothetical protein
MSLKEIIKAKQGSHVVGQMYRVAELTKKARRNNNGKK